MAPELTHLPRRVAARLRARCLTVLAVAVLAAAPVRAATYYLSPAGSDGNAGTSPAAAWATLAKANGALAPGDVVILANGTYAGAPDPVASGRAGQRIGYVGNLSSPASVVVTGLVTLPDSFVTVKGMDLSGGMSLHGARDSVAHCNIEGLLPGILGADDCVIADCTVRAERFWVEGCQNDTCAWDGRAERDTVQDCALYLNPVNVYSHTVHTWGVRQLVLNRCRFVINVAASATNASITKFFFTEDMQVTDCSWDATNNCVTGCDEAGWFLLRDETRRCTFTRDTIVLHGPGPVQLFAACTGSFIRSCYENKWDHCVFKMPDATTFGTAMVYEDMLQRDTLTYCTFVGADRALRFGVVGGPAVIDHCTFVGYGGLVVDGHDNALAWTGGLSFTNNIVAMLGPDRTRNGVPMYIPSSLAAGHLTGNSNLYFASLSADSTYDYGGMFSPPGVGHPWYALTGMDADSITGDPRFANTSSVLAFDPRLLPGSPALGRGTGGSDLGATSATVAPTDATPPATVSTLVAVAATANSVTLRWTAPGDDGASGTPARYDLRRSPLPITAASFAAATPVSPQPPVVAGGTLQTYTVPSLGPATTYYFALRAVDEAGNWSGVSNSVQGITTAASDNTPPATIGDLRAY